MRRNNTLPFDERARETVQNLGARRNSAPLKNLIAAWLKCDRDERARFMCQTGLVGMAAGIGWRVFTRSIETPIERAHRALR